MDLNRRIVYLQYGNPAAYPPLQHSSTILAASGWKVLFLGAHTRGVESLNIPPHPNVMVMLQHASSGGWRLKVSYFWFAVWAMWRTILWRPQWVYASDVLSAPIVLVLKTVFGLKVIYHEHDAFDPTGATAFMRICLAARGRLSRRSDLNILPNEARLDHFRRENCVVPERCMSVWNCPSSAEVKPARSAAPSNDFWLLFQGSIVPVRLPLAVLRALAQLPQNVKLRVIGYETIGSRGYVGRLKDEAARLGISDRVEFLGTLATREELLNRSRTCAVGLAFMPLRTDDLNMKFMAGASNKPFEYLACGLPLLVSDRPDWRSLFVDNGFALACDPEDANSIAESVISLLEKSQDALRMGESGRRRIASEWNYERQFEPVLKFMTGSGHTGATPNTSTTAVR